MWQKLVSPSLSIKTMRSRLFSVGESKPHFSEVYRLSRAVTIWFTGFWSPFPSIHITPVHYIADIF